MIRTCCVCQDGRGPDVRWREQTAAPRSVATQVRVCGGGDTENGGRLRGVTETDHRGLHEACTQCFVLQQQGPILHRHGIQQHSQVAQFQFRTVGRTQRAAGRPKGIWGNLHQQ